MSYFYEPLPNTDYSLREHWMPVGKTYNIKINKDTLNDRFDYPLIKGDGVFRILTLGDSFTFGQNVSTNNNWTELLEDMMNEKLDCRKVKKFEIINLGVMGYDTQYAVERYRIRGIKYKPDLIIWTFSDFQRILELMMPIVNKYDNIFTKLLERFGIYYINWQWARENMLRKIGEKGLIKLQEKQMREINKLYDGRILFIALSSTGKYADTIKKQADSRKAGYFLRSNISWDNKELFLPDKHFNEKGHKRFMNEILEYLKNNRLLVCD